MEKPYVMINKSIQDKSMDEKQELIKNIAKEINLELGNISDGYHTFNELYAFRKVYSALAFNLLHKEGIQVFKSWKHSDGELCFGGGWFIIVAVLPTGQISNHYEERDWDLFDIPSVEIPPVEFDGHTSVDAYKRLLSYTLNL